MEKRRKKRKINKTNSLIVVLIFMLVVILGATLVMRLFSKESKSVATSTQPTTITPSPTPVVDNTPRGEGNTAFTDTESLLLLANKKHKLPDGYVPSDLVTIPAEYDYYNYGCQLKEEAANALVAMLQAANAEGLYPKATTTYRDESFQATLYNNYAGTYGTESADTFSSRPGYSDHQTGLAADISCEANGWELSEDFENTAEGQWLAQHAHEYGFIMRYPKDKQDITGYTYEPWHFRYIGVEYATALYETDPNESFEEFFEVEGGDYADKE